MFLDLLRGGEGAFKRRGEYGCDGEVGKGFARGLGLLHMKRQSEIEYESASEVKTYV